MKSAFKSAFLQARKYIEKKKKRVVASKLYQSSRYSIYHDLGITFVNAQGPTEYVCLCHSQELTAECF